MAKEEGLWEVSASDPASLACWKGEVVGGGRCYLAEMCSGSEEGSYLRLIDFCITQL